MEGGTDGDMSSPLTLPLDEGQGRFSFTRGQDKPAVSGHWEPIGGRDDGGRQTIHTQYQLTYSTTFYMRAQTSASLPSWMQI